MPTKLKARPARKAKPEPKAREQHLLTDNQRVLIILLSKMGGFSTYAIAKRIFRTDEPTDGEKASVASFRARQGIKLRWWRDMESASAQNYARDKIADMRNESKVSMAKQEIARNHH